MQNVIDKIFKLFDTYGHLAYGEDVSVWKHSVQCGLMAIQDGANDHLVVAAFLHDIGHICYIDNGVNTESMGDYGIVDHEHLGSYFLRSQGFSETICIPIENHVLAKRYLCSTDPTYFSKLSVASKETFFKQGGKLKEIEESIFRKSDYFKESIQLRIYDDEGKNVDFKSNKNHQDIFLPYLLNVLNTSL